MFNLSNYFVFCVKASRVKNPDIKIAGLFTLRTLAQGLWEANPIQTLYGVRLCSHYAIFARRSLFHFFYLSEKETKTKKNIRYFNIQVLLCTRSGSKN